MSRTFRGVLCVLALLSAVVLGVGAWSTQAAAGRALLAEKVAAALSRGIAGRAKLDRIADVDLDGVSVRGLTFEAPSGEQVLHIEEARISPDWAALLQGTLAVDQARVQGGELTIREKDNGEVPLELAFQSPGSSKSKEDDGGDGPRLALHGLQVNDLTVIINLTDLDTMRVTEVEALVRIDLSPAGDLDVRFTRTAGTLHDHPLGDRAALSEVDGRVRGRARHILELKAKVGIDDERFALNIDYFDREKRPVEIRAKNVAASWVGAKMKAVAAASALVSTVDLQVNPGDEG